MTQRTFSILTTISISCNDRKYKNLCKGEKIMTENGNGSLVMPVSPMYGGNGGFGNSFGGDSWAW